MSLWRVDTSLEGPDVRGNGISQLFFLNTGGTPQQAADAVIAFWQSVDADMSSSDAWRVEAEVAEVDIATGTLLSVTPVTGNSSIGGASGDRLPPQTQALIRWRTGAAVEGRELRGRLFVPAMVESENTATGTPSSGLVGRMNSAGAALIAASNSDLMVWSKTWGQARLVTAASCWTQWAVLRSRRD